ncbi:hypothetical protein V8E54_001619 [Elaphomyces granulatus]
MSAVSKKLRWDNADNNLKLLAASAVRQREWLRRKVKRLDGDPATKPGPPCEDTISRPNSVWRLCDPAFSIKLPFPIRAYPKRSQTYFPYCLWDQRIWEVTFTGCPSAKVIYIPDCRELMKDPVSYVIAAMLFAWERNQRRVMALKALEDINVFVKGQQDVILVVDQLNALEKEDDDDEPVTKRKAELREWLQK